MKTKKIVLGCLAWILGALTFLPMVVYTWAIKNGTSVTNYKLFNSLKGASATYDAVGANYHGVWNDLVRAFVIIALVAAFIYMVCYLIGLLSQRNYKIVHDMERIASIAMIISGIMILIFGIIFMSVNTRTIGAVTISMMAKAGFYLGFLMPMLGGICGVIASNGRYSNDENY